MKRSAIVCVLRSVRWPSGVELDPDTLQRLVAQLTPRIIDQLRNTPTFWGNPARLTCGENVHLVNTLINVTSGFVHIEDHVFFGHNVCLLTGTHDMTRFDKERQDAYPLSGRDILIRQGAWIASNATIIGPCIVGRDAVVAVGSVVLHDVEEGWLYAGVPARRIRPVSPNSSRQGAANPTF
jgi:acetyltransferase-like isoleucine patch superfamily enzyme